MGANMQYINYFVELLPVCLAILVIINCAKYYTVVRRRKDKFTVVLAIISSVLLIFAQTSWFVTYAIYGGFTGTELANHIWTLFNTLTMATFFVLSYTRGNDNVEQPSSSGV